MNEHELALEIHEAMQRVFATEKTQRVLTAMASTDCEPNAFEDETTIIH